MEMRSNGKPCHRFCGRAFTRCAPAWAGAAGFIFISAGMPMIGRLLALLQG